MKASNVDCWGTKITKVKFKHLRRRDTGEVSNEQLKRDVERGVAYFWGAKPWREQPVPVVGRSSRMGKGRLDLVAAVRVALAIGEPMRGALKGIADSNGLDYAAFMKAYYKAKRTGVLPTAPAPAVPLVVVEDKVGRVAEELVQAEAAAPLPRGEIKRRAEAEGLNYDTLMTRFCRLRKKHALEAGRACA